MVRPCFLVVDREFPGSISTRKLVIETAMFNVLTAYSADEALATLKAFPNVQGIVLDADVHGMPCDVVVSGLKGIKPGVPIVLILGPGDNPCPGADFYLESFDPKELLKTLARLLPRETAAIEKREEKLNREHP
jgi:DNA-binding NtrC family response regulator